ncbi:MAG: SUMF1/EgtB/PvdO family nonheme iron enzyme, partial [Pirellulales bacterium]|nr:SUMF1/EgtB/PvdO family nonheme iron enzyme [Pirellulales bacterium]
VMMCDPTFLDPENGRYQLDAMIDHGQKEFGGYDSVVLWHAYPRIGFDRRNQFDFYRDMPGGLKGLRDLTRRFHARGVKVFINYNPWDTGTRRESESDVESLVEMVVAMEADGIFLDTLERGATALRAKLDAARPGVVLESELALPLAAIPEHHMSWAQEFNDGLAPSVLRNKWYERRHMQHQIRRWAGDHASELHAAWMNGSGMMVWENVFGSLKPWCPRDKSILRSIATIQRRYQDLFAGEDWTPLVPAGPSGVYASRWQTEGLRLWTLVNRMEKSVVGRIETVEPGVAGCQWFDLIAGRQIAPVESGAGLRISTPLGPRGVGAVVCGAEAALGQDFAAFLTAQAQVAAAADFDPRPPVVRPRLEPVAPTKRYLPDEIPSEMALVDVDVEADMRSTITSRECGFHVEPYAYDAIQRHKQVIEQVRRVWLRPYAIDRTPVTNAQFAEFLKSSGYRPRHPENFLKHWPGHKLPFGREDHPVVYVDLDDARAYARWAGKRLPTEEEWQYAAAGPEGLNYPWGDRMEPGRCNPGGGTTPVMAFPEGRSPLGCHDMCGNTWEWTESQQSDGRTRFCVLKGGSWFAAVGSLWYADGGPRPTHHAAKFLLAWPGLDRCGTIGFRCVVNVARK